MTLDEPLFMKHPEWVETPGGDCVAFFDDGRGYHLRDGVPEDVRESCEEFYEAVEAPADEIVTLAGL